MRRSFMGCCKARRAAQSMNTTTVPMQLEQLLEVKTSLNRLVIRLCLMIFPTSLRGVYAFPSPSEQVKQHSSYSSLVVLKWLIQAQCLPDAKTVMFQEDRLLENLSVMANIMLHTVAPKEQKQSARERIKEALVG